MKKIVTFIVCLVLFCTLCNHNITYAKSEFESYNWQKLNHYYTGRDIIGIADNGRTFVVVGEHGTILKSANGTAWEKVYSGYEEDFCNITWDGNAFKALTQNGKILSSINGNKWILLDQKTKVVTKTAISIDSQNKISQNKIFGYSKRGNIAVAVGEAGAIYYGTQKGQKPLKQAVLTTNSHIIDKLGNALVLCVGTSQMYVENNFVEESIPKPYTVKTGKNETAYVPFEKVVKAIGGSYRFDSKTSTAYITYKLNKIEIKIGSKTIKLNGKGKTVSSPAIVKNKVVFVPISTFSFLGKQTYFKQKLIIISDIKNFFNEEKEQPTIDAITSLSSSTDYKVTSLSEKVIDTLVDEGTKLYPSHNLGNYYGAFEYFQIAEEIEPSSEIYENLGETCNVLGFYNKAIDYLNKGIKVNCISFDLYVLKGGSLGALGKYDEAMENISKANEIRPNDNKLLFSKASLDLYKGDFEKAIKGYDEFIKKDTSCVNAFFYKATALMNIYRYQEAIECFNKVIELDPKYVMSYLEKGKCLYELQKYAEAIVEFDNALKLNPDADFIFEIKGDVLCKLNKYDEAAVAYKKALEIHPDYEPFHEKCGDVLSALGKNDEAISEYDKALELEIGLNEKLFEKKAELIYKMNKHDLLLDACGKFEQIGYDNAFINYYKALGYCAQCKYDDAMKSIKLAINNDRHYRKKIKEDDRFYILKDREDYKELITAIKIYMDDTFKADGAGFFEQSMFRNIDFYKTSTVGSNIEDNSLIELADSIFVHFFNNNILTQESALEYGIYKESPLIEGLNSDNISEQVISIKDFKILSSEIIMCGDENGSVKYVVIHSRHQWTLDGEQKESDVYSLLIKVDNGTWKFYYTLY